MQRACLQIHSMLNQLLAYERLKAKGIKCTRRANHSTGVAMRILRWNSFLVTNASRSEGKLTYIRLNTQTPCPPHPVGWFGIDCQAGERGNLCERTTNHVVT
jgi:hypothetical protein